MIINIPLVTALISIVAAQTLKIPIHLLTKRSLNLKIAVSTGGMPSSHSAAVCSLAASVGLVDGFHSSIFAIAVLFSVITMYDAMGIRRHAGTHATILNRIIRLFPAHSNELQEDGALKEMLGHRPIEVCAGALLGVVIGILMN
ncbi:divergent PAP2 family protein [Paenibacillus albus]|uniref:Divergent PAP2 family protein n=1 Tax=Paenibacillus albus TaxID=2495582 RepID=A0A3Q8X5N8_9BACL|nr:divergent PAP2 family protein [Paenibacillus albus]